MRTSRITDDMFARIPALLLEGTTKAEIAEMYGVTLGTLVVLCSQRGISLRKGGPVPKRTKRPEPTNLTLPDEPLPLSDGVLKSLREATRAMEGQHGTAGQRSLGEDRQGRSLQGSAGRGGCIFTPESGPYGHRARSEACQSPT